MQRFQRGFEDGGHCDSVAKCVEHFDRISVLAVRRTVMINYLHHITAAKSVFGNVASKSSVSIKFEAHGKSKLPEKVRKREGAFTSTRGACALQINGSTESRPTDSRHKKAQHLTSKVLGSGDVLLICSRPFAYPLPSRA
jgi:hypothetical protein